jgi:hypothetical protein
MSETDTKNVMAVCPICDASKKIPVPKSKIMSKENGTTSVHVPSKLVCDHEFYMYIDKNFVIRDYLVTDINFYSEKDIHEKAKNEILEKLIEIAPVPENIYKAIRKENFLSLLFAAFCRSPIIFLVNELEEENFKIVLSGLAAFYPKVAKSVKILNPEKFLDIEKNQAASLEGVTVYNVSYQLSVRKPFRDSDAEVFGQVVDMLKGKKFKLQRVYAKNVIDIMDRYYEGYKKLDAKDKDDSVKIIKALTAIDPQHKDMLNSDWFNVFEKRMEFERKFPQYLSK